MTLSTVIFLTSFLPNLQLNIGKKIPKNCKNYWWIIDNCICSTKPSYIFQLKRELIVWKYIFNLFHFKMLIENRNPKFRPLCLFILTFHEYETRFVFVFGWIIICPCLSFFLVSRCFVYYICVIINIS